MVLMLLPLAASATEHMVSQSELHSALAKQAARFESLLDAQAQKLERLETMLSLRTTSDCAAVQACVTGKCSAAVAVGVASCYPQQPCQVTCRDETQQLVDAEEK